jgi:hypothetical protein
MALMKIKRIKMNESFRSFFRIVLAALISSVLISTLLISLPSTEKLYEKVRYDITFAPEFWKNEYTLDLSIKASDFSRREKKIEETKAVLEKRLRKYGVQEIQFSEKVSDSRDKAILVLKIESDKDKESVERLIAQRYYLRFVLRKEGVDFESEENQFAVYDPENYTGTPFTLHHFRQVYITKLKTTTGEDGYFSIYKPWEYRAGKFYEYFDKYAGQYAGVQIDGFVSPIVVPVTASGVSGGITSRLPFALGVTGESNDIKILNILTNTGVIPVEYDLVDTKELKSPSFEVNFLKTSLLFILLTVIIYIASYLFTKKGSLTSFMAFAITSTTVVTVMKLFSIPLQPITAVYSALLVTTLLPILMDSKAVSLTIALIGLILSYIGSGYIRDVGIYTFYILSTFVALQYVISYLIKLVKDITNND